MNPKKKTLNKAPDEQINSVSNLFSTLSHPLRLKILWLLKKKRTLSVNQIQAELKTSQSNISQHLSLLKANKLVVEERRGKEVFYSLTATKKISKVLISALHLIGYQLAVNSELLSTYSEIFSYWA